MSRRGGVRLAPIAEEVWYLPTYIVDDKWQDSTGEVSLFVRSFRLRDRKAGPLLQVASDVWTFDSAEAMVEEIERLGLQELPAEADGDPLYVPDELLLIEGAKIERAASGVSHPGAENGQPRGRNT